MLTVFRVGKCAEAKVHSFNRCIQQQLESKDVLEILEDSQDTKKNSQTVLVTIELWIGVLGIYEQQTILICPRRTRNNIRLGEYNTWEEQVVEVSW